ncbi:MAG: hypothetical protein LDL30_07780 [Desulfovibrio sp.]|nr:hypothetical protein [Desulfovibrio sp.]MCA1985547.1 hypothetical protein [Desulfovibrio sp.]
MAANPLDDISIRFEENGIEVVQELDKSLVTAHGGWCTVAFKYREWDPKKEAYGVEKFGIRRYRKRDGRWQQQAKMSINSRDHARKLVEIFNGWLDQPEAS